MGATNAMSVATHWTDLPEDAYKALNYMALITLDRDETPTYWGGAEALISAIGRDGNAPTAPDRQALRRALRILVDRGAVAVDKPAARGRPGVYSLHLMRSDSERS